MSNPSEEPTRDERTTGTIQGEQGWGGADAQQIEPGWQTLADVGETRGKQMTPSRPRPSSGSSRRRMLRVGLTVAAASVGAGTLLEMSGEAASAAPNKVGVFSSNTADAPAVSATGTNGATGAAASSDTGTGVSGTSTGTGFASIGVHGTGRVGVSGTSNTTPFQGGAGVVGTGITGVSGSSTGAQGIGVSGSGDSGVGVEGGSSSSDGVKGVSSTGVGVHGLTTGGGLAGKFDGDVQVNGNFSATGAKNFVQAHPADPGKEIVYAALEGGEAGTYARGTGELLRGRAVLDLPEHFGLVTAPDGLTAQLTPRGEWLQLYVAELTPTQLVVREAAGKSGRFDYVIWGVRQGYERYEAIRSKR